MVTRKKNIITWWSGRSCNTLRSLTVLVASIAWPAWHPCTLMQSERASVPMRNQSPKILLSVALQWYVKRYADWSRLLLKPPIADGVRCKIQIYKLQPGCLRRIKPWEKQSEWCPFFHAPAWYSQSLFPRTGDVGMFLELPIFIWWRRMPFASSFDFI